MRDSGVVSVMYSSLRSGLVAALACVLSISTLAQTSRDARSTREQRQQTVTSNVADRVDDSEEDFIVVPAGTLIRADRVAERTVWPVRVGFATPIPALSKVVIEDLGQVYVNGEYYQVLSLTSVTVGKTDYRVEAYAEVPPQNAGMEVTFTLKTALKISR